MPTVAVNLQVSVELNRSVDNLATVERLLVSTIENSLARSAIESAIYGSRLSHSIEPGSLIVAVQSPLGEPKKPDAPDDVSDEPDMAEVTDDPDQTSRLSATELLALKQRRATS